ncbi:hypothetical protein ACP275_13G006000 [Erythranthe tilingii]
MSSGGVKGGASRVSIPSGVRKTIENIKEITGQNHSEDEIYAMLKDCSMDPNETTQKLLLLDTFHEVKRKRDRKKENLNKEPAEIKWKPGTQVRANRVGRGNYPSRHISHDAGGGRNLAAQKENVTNLTEKGPNKAPSATSQDMRKNDTPSVSSPTTAVSNGPSGIIPKSTSVVHDNHVSAGGGVDESNTTASLSKSEGPLLLSSPVDSIKNPNGPGTKYNQQHQKLELSNNAAPNPSAPPMGSIFSSSDPVLLPSQDLPPPSIRREVGSQRVPTELIDDNPNENKTASARISSSDVGVATLQQKVAKDSQVVGKNQHLDMPAASSALGASTVSRPSSNYNNRSQVTGSQKGPGKEWKPKSSNSNITQDAPAASSSEVSTVSVGAHPALQTTTAILASKESTIELQRKLEELHMSNSQHVIIPSHLHVPEVEKLGFCFGSFDASFELDMNQNGVPGSDRIPLQLESSEAIDEPVEELQLSNQNALVAADDTEIKYPDHPQQPSEGLEKNSPSEVEVSSSIPPDYSEPRPDVAPASHQHPVLHTSNYSYGFMPPILGGQLTPSESSESQARDAHRLPGFVMPQSFDPASYYAQFYRAGLDSDGRISPFHSAGAANKYNGNAGLVSAQSSHSPQELQGGVPLVLSTASPTALVTQAAGVMQSSINAAQQQPLPVFRQPAGVHLSHYPPNYIPYGPYFSPFYVPPPPIHQFLSNGAFPQQQPQPGNLYPATAGTNAKYSVSQYKQGPNTGTSAHMGMPGSYGPYGLSMANYASSSAPAPVTSTSNEDLAASQVKENNIYVSGQQNEGSGVWFTGPGRDISTLQPNSFYNLPQGQLAFAPTQGGHGPFTGIFHPAQAVTNVHQLLQQSQAITNPVDMVVPSANVYQQQQQQQQPQHAQLNWPSNY